MATPKLLSLLALALVALVTLSSAPLGANALVADRAQVARHVRAHDAVAKRKRSDASSPSSSGLCIPRPSSSLDSSLPTSTPPPPSSTPPPPSSTPSSSASNDNRKWCIAWGADNSVLSKFALPKVRYIYDWSEDFPSDSFTLGLEPMPMLWGYRNADAFKAKVVQGYAHIILGMNEPNEPSQSNMSPGDAANMWRTYIDPLKDLGYTLGSPACTDDSAGLQWYQEFFQDCAGCHFDFIAFHAYTTNASHMIEYATTLHNTYNLPIAITEFADQDYSGANNQPTMDQVWDFAGKVVDFVDNTEWVKLACPFGVVTDLQGVDGNNALLGPDGSPTQLAYYYFG